LSVLGDGKTSIFNISLNWENPILEKKLSLILAEDSQKNSRWINNFEELKDKVEFLILYGSILHSPKEAKDIDILGITLGKNNFQEADKIIRKIQKSQIKKIHFENLTKAELKKEIKKPNEIFIDAIKKGVVLFGQDKFITFVKEISKND